MPLHALHYRTTYLRVLLHVGHCQGERAAGGVMPRHQQHEEVVQQLRVCEPAGKHSEGGGLVVSGYQQEYFMVLTMNWVPYVHESIGNQAHYVPQSGVMHGD
jgi:hypothetical protein